MLIKERVDKKALTGFHCRILTDNYAHDMEHVLGLVEEAKKDFPEIDINRIKVIAYGKHPDRSFSRNERKTGIEFFADGPSIMQYTPVHTFDYTLN